MGLIILKIILFIVPFFAYAICVKSKTPNYLEEIKLKNVLKIIVTTIMLIAILLIINMASNSTDEKSKYLILYFLLFRCLYEILVPIMRRLTKGKKESNEKFRYYDSIFFPCIYSSFVSAVVFTILQVANISSFMMVYLEIGRMMLLSLIIYFLLSILRCMIEEKGIILKEYNLADKVYIYIHGVKWVAKEPVLDIYIVVLLALYFVNLFIIGKNI